MKKPFFLFVIMLLPMMVSADDSGTCGESLTWTYIERTHTLTISGTGTMANYNNWPNKTPWYSFRLSIRSIVINEGVTSIGAGAFYNCSGLTSITIPSSVTLIGGAAFENCSSLASLAIPSSVTSISSMTFKDCSSLTSIIIPSSVNSIGKYAFKGCSSLSSITIPSNVTTIYEETFYGCSSLSSIIIPSNVTAIGESAFRDCSSLTSITIPSSVTTINNTTFYGCSSLTSITIPCNVTSIGGSAFYGCSSLTSIIIPNGVTSIGGSAFRGCSSLASITIPDSILSIGIWAFDNCSSLASITIPRNLTEIGQSAFSGCSGLTSINVETGNTKYDSRDNCNGIIETKTNTLIAGCQNTTIPNSVTSIGLYAFSGCSSLSSITIPSSVADIGEYAFEGCKLENIVCRCPLAQLKSYAFSEATFNHAVLYVPEGKRWVSIYDGGWYPFVNIFETVMNAEDLSLQKAYMVMNAHTYGYMVYDAINNNTKIISDFHHVDANVPYNSWQIVEASGQKYLYNIGAHKYAVMNSSGEWQLTDTPTPLSMKSDTDGKFTFNGKDSQWYFVLNEQTMVDHSVMAVKDIVDDAGVSFYYMLNGRRANQLQKGLNIVVMQDGTTKKVVVK